MNSRDKSIIFSIAGLLLVFTNALSHFDISSTSIGSYRLFQEVTSYLDKNVFAKFLLLTGTSIFGFVWFFKNFLSIYSNPSVWNYFHKNISLDGNWVYVFDDYASKCTIYGLFTIVHTMDKIAITKARCWYSGTKGSLTVTNQRGIWRSESVTQDNGTCWVFYSMNISKPLDELGEQLYYGVMRMDQDYDSKLGTKLINGSINDHGAAVEHKGIIYAKRLLAEDNKLYSHWDNLPNLIEKYLERDVVMENACERKNGISV
jgi:hypothetical protein